jgi:hypothetical protein
VRIQKEKASNIWPRCYRSKSVRPHVKFSNIMLQGSGMGSSRIVLARIVARESQQIPGLFEPPTTHPIGSSLQFGVAPIDLIGNLGCPFSILYSLYNGSTSIQFYHIEMSSAIQLSILFDWRNSLGSINVHGLQYHVRNRTNQFANRSAESCNFKILSLSSTDFPLLKWKL